MTRPKPTIDRILLVLLFAAYAWLAVAATYSRRDGDDMIAYALPGANLVVRGSLDIAQLGPQFGFDRHWLFNAPLPVLGPVPIYAAAGVGRIQYLAGVATLAVLNLAVFTVVCRRILSLRSAAFATLVAFAFLGTRGLPTADLYNQRYSILNFSLLLLTFAPGTDDEETSGRPLPWWRWLLAGILPLAHPVLAVASAVFVINAVWRARGRVGSPAQLWSAASLWAFACGAAASAAWWLRPTPLAMQFFAHVRFDDFRRAGSFAGLLDAAASPVAAVPTRVLAIATAVAALAIVGLFLRGGAGRRRVLCAVPAALVVVLVLPLDAWRGFKYYQYLLTGLGPVLLCAASTRRTRAIALAGLALMAVANASVCTRLDRQPPDWTTTAQAQAFVESHTLPGDRIVVGPPFVLLSSTGVSGRSVPRTMPQPYFLAGFDRGLFLREIASQCDVYVGNAAYYGRPMFIEPAAFPLFPSASIERYDFAGEPIIVVRRR